MGIKKVSLFLFFLLITVTLTYKYTNINAADCAITIGPNQSIQSTINNASSGSVICLSSGNYDQKITVSKNNITLQNAPNQTPVITGESGSITLLTISSNGTTIQGLTFKSNVRQKNAPNTGWIVVNGSANNTTFKNNRVETKEPYLHPAIPNTDERDRYRDYGIVVNGANNTIIDNNVFIGGLQQAIHPKNMVGKKLYITNNKISHTWQSSIHVGGSENAVNGGNNCNQTANILIKNNILEYSKIEDGIQFTPASSPDLNTKNVGAIVTGNIIRFNAENGVDLKGTSCVVVEKNIIYGNQGDNDGGFKGGNANILYKKVGNNFVLDSSGTYDMNAFSSITRGSRTASQNVIIRQNVVFDSAPSIHIRTENTNWKVYNNTFVNNNRNFMGTNQTIHDKYEGIAIDRTNIADILNNIVVSQNTAYVQVNSNASGLKNDYSLYFDPAGAPNFVVNQTQNKTFAQFKALSGSDNNSIIANPVFAKNFSNLRPNAEDYTNYNFTATNFELPDFYLQQQSPAVNAGGFLTKTVNGGSGRVIKVQDASYFSDGDGVTRGDVISIGSANNTAEITNVNIATNELTVSQNTTWQNNQSVSLAYVGSAPDIGAYEYGQVVVPTPSTPTPTIDVPTPTPTPDSCICTKEINPVCGSNGITYDNACLAECDNVTYSPGACIDGFSKYDLNKDTKIDILDIITLIRYVFGG